jgi:hypothetical protein
LERQITPKDFHELLAHVQLFGPLGSSAVTAGIAAAFSGRPWDQGEAAYQRTPVGTETVPGEEMRIWAEALAEAELQREERKRAYYRQCESAAEDQPG